MKTFEITNQQFSRAVIDFKDAAKENIEVEFFDGAFWVYASELATLRLFRVHTHKLAIGRQGFSKNLNTHYFTLESPSFTGEMSTKK